MATFGQEHEAPFEVFAGLVNEIAFAESQALRDALRGDEIKNRLMKALAQIEKVCREELKRKTNRTFWS